MKETLMENISPKIKRGWLRALLFLITAIITSNLFAGIGLVAIMLSAGYDISIMTNQELLTTELNKIGLILPLKLFELLGLMLPLWLFMRFINRKPIKSLGLTFKGYKKDFKLGLAIGVGLIATGFIILSILGHLTVSHLSFPLLDLILYFLLFTVVAFHEEIFVRGYLLNNLMASMNKYAALSITSLFFMSLHLLNSNISVLSVINLFLAGIVLGIYYIHKPNLWLPIGMHLTWNYFQGPVFGFEVSGLNTIGIFNQNLSGHDIITGGEFGFEGSIIATILIIGIIYFLDRKFSH